MVQPLPNFKKRRFFIPDHHKWIIITNRFYDQLRKVPNWETNHDLDAVEDDARNVREGILGLGARAIRVLTVKKLRCYNDIRSSRDIYKCNYSFLPWRGFVSVTEENYKCMHPSQS